MTLQSAVVYLLEVPWCTLNGHVCTAPMMMVPGLHEASTHTEAQRNAWLYNQPVLATNQHTCVRMSTKQPTHSLNNLRSSQKQPSRHTHMNTNTHSTLSQQHKAVCLSVRSSNNQQLQQAIHKISSSISKGQDASPSSHELGHVLAAELGNLGRNNSTAVALHVEKNTRYGTYTHTDVCQRRKRESMCAGRQGARAANRQ